MNYYKPRTHQECRDCKMVKPIEQFRLRKKGHHLRQSYCLECSRERVREYSQKRYRAWSSEEKLQYSRRNAARRTQDQKRDYMLRSSFGITLAEWQELYDRQDGLCAICRDDDRRKRSQHKMLVTDHCHGTGTVRGLLCNNCNGGLGFLKDNSDVLSVALEYLQRPPIVIAAVREKRNSNMNNKELNLWKRFGLSLSAFISLASQRDYKCDICGDRGDLVVDHDHNRPKGEIRGLLCATCNQGIGMFDDSVDLLTSARQYLKAMLHSHFG